jgi:predicted dehydrogenase
MRTPTSIGIVGMGGRGSQLACTFDDLANTNLSWLCDLDAEARAAHRRRFPLVRWADSITQLLDDDTVDAVAIATPAYTHYELAMQALRAEKHVFIQHPLALRGEDARAVVAEARRRSRVLMVGDAMLYDPAMWKLRECIQNGALGDIYYIDASCQRFGTGSTSESVLWGLGPSAVGLLLGLLADQPIDVSARGDAYLRDGVTDVAICHLRFATGIVVTLHLSWLDPRTVNRVSVVGAAATAVADYGNGDRRLTIYNTQAAAGSDGYSKRIQHDQGDIVSPRLPDGDPLRAECEQFVRSVGAHLSRALFGAEAVTVVDVIEALERSLADGGAPELIDGFSGSPEVPVRPLLIAIPGQGSTG